MVGFLLKSAAGSLAPSDEWELPRWARNTTCTHQRPSEDSITVRVRVRVTLRLTVSQSVCLGVEHNYGTFDHRIFIYLFSFWMLQSCHFGGGALSDVRSGLSCVSLVTEVYSSLSFVQNIYIYITIYSVKHFYKTIAYLNIFTKVVNIYNNSITDRRFRN
jgi:hypothetical protein